MAEQLVALITFALASTGSPGGATSLATASGARFGFVRSLPLIGGIATALALLVAVSGTGISVVLLAVPSLETGMKVIGSVYLFWLAIVILRAGAPDETDVSSPTPIGFFGGVILLLINPKTWAMGVGVAGSYSSVSGNSTVDAAITGTVFAIAACLSLSIWAFTGAFFARKFTIVWQWHLLNFGMSILLVLSIASFWL